jgi:CDP-glycerol glycerophosphotransferase
VVKGTTLDTFGKIVPRLGEASATAVFTLLESDASFTCPVTIRAAGSDRLDWEFGVKIPPGLPFVRPMRFALSIVIRNGASTNSAAVVNGMEDKPTARVVSRERLREGLRQRFVFNSTETGRRRLRLATTPGKRGELEVRFLRLAERLRLLPAPGLPVDPNSQWVREAYRLLRLMPLRRNRVLFESSEGTGWQNSPRHVSEALRQARPRIRQAWVHAEPGLPRPLDSAIVKRGTLGHLWELATAKYLVSDHFLPDHYVKRRGQVHLQTWHSVPLAVVGFDEPQMDHASDSVKQEIRRRVGYWDYLNSPSPYFERTFVSAFRYRGELIRHGSPRNDPLVTLKGRPDEVLRSLDLPQDRRILLYVPTSRVEPGSEGTEELPLALDRWVSELGDEYYLLLCARRSARFRVPRRLAPYCMDVSEYDDVNDLFRVSEGLITDYSSAMFDYIALDRPIFVYAPHHDADSASGRRFYFDIEKTPPGPVSFDQDDLHGRLRAEWDGPESRRLRAEFRQMYCGIEPGTSSMETVRTVWCR